MKTRAPGKKHTKYRRRRSGNRSSEPVWLYGHHTIRAALANPARRIRRLLIAQEIGDSLAGAFAHGLRRRVSSLEIERVPRDDIDRRFGAGAVHQGVALEVEPLAEVGFGDACNGIRKGSVAVCLDQVSDPQNVGAVLRSASAFGAAFLLMPARHTPGGSAALAKAASGGLETVPMVRVVNLASALERLREAGMACIGFDPESPHSLGDVRDRHADRHAFALVLGAEGAGLRKRTRESCDALASIPILSRQGSLNVSVSCAIGLYEFASGQRKKSGGEKAKKT